MKPGVPIRVLHCITSLHGDGAQRMLLKLCAAYDRNRFSFGVLSISSVMPLAEHFEALRVPVSSLGMKPAFFTPGALRRCQSHIAAFAPDIIQGWMFHGNLLSSLAARVSSCDSAVIWNIRRALASDGDPIGTRAVIKLNALFSSSPYYIIYCGSALAREHETHGFCAAKTRVIPNGFDTDVFGSPEITRAEQRRAWGIPEDSLLIGCAGRFHPQKDYGTFLRAASMVAQRYPDTMLVLGGRDVAPHNTVLNAMIRENGLANRVRLLGAIANMPSFLTALDIFCSSSAVEGFSNVIGEAMASRVPCVATDAGATVEIVGNTGLVVRRKDAVHLAWALQQMIAIGPTARQQLGERARQRVLHHFSIATVINRYEDLYAEVAAVHRHVPKPLPREKSTASLSRRAHSG